MNKTFDSLHMGRSSIDLYSNDIGTPFVDINSYAAYVGGIANQYQRRRKASRTKHGAAHRHRR